VPAGPVKDAAHLALGRAGEDAAQALMLGQGYRVLARNWRSRGLELDLVCEKGEQIVFVEVKTRAAHGMSTPADGLTPAKRRKLAKAIGLFLSKHDLWERPCRVDLVCVLQGLRGLALERHENVLDFSAHAPGTAWQPW